MKVLERGIRRLSHALSWAVMVTLAAMMVFITVSVFMRYVLNSPIAGDLEVVEVMMMVVVLMGLAYTQAVEGHVAVRLLVDRFPPRLQAGIDIFNFILATGIMLLIVWQSSNQGIYSFQCWERSDILSIPICLFRFLIPLGFLAWALEALLKVCSSVNKLRGKIV